jgi:SAM-dependent methyltransferase
MTESPSVIKADFDRIAALPSAKWNHNAHYHDLLLREITACRNALEIGCGTGEFSRLLAKRCENVLALDVSPRMISLAREQSQEYPNIDYRTADAMMYALPAGHFDCAVSIATLHHLPLEDILRKLAKALTPGGVLAVLDLYQSAGLADLLVSAAALPADVLMRLIRNGRLRESRAARKAWTDHTQHEHFLTLSHIRTVCAKILPGAQVRRHFFWRYSILWEKTEL